MNFFKKSELGETTTDAFDDAPNDKTLLIAISSRALFDLQDSHAVFTQQGVETYSKYQIDNEDRPLDKGVAFSMTRKFLKINDDRPRGAPDNFSVDIVLVSRNSADTGLRIFNSIEHYGLPIKRAVFTGGHPTQPYLHAFGADLFLSADSDDVRAALDSGIAAATILHSNTEDAPREPLRIAFDGDSVLFSDEADRVYQQDGATAFIETERRDAEHPLSEGPFKKLLAKLHDIQKNFGAENSPIRTALITTRAAPAHKRAIKTLRDWGVRVNVSMFLGGLPKGKFLRQFGADIFFDDRRENCDSAREHVATGHVPYGIVNRDDVVRDDANRDQVNRNKKRSA